MVKIDGMAPIERDAAVISACTRYNDGSHEVLFPDNHQAYERTSKLRCSEIYAQPPGNLCDIPVIVTGESSVIVALLDVITRTLHPFV